MRTIIFIGALLIGLGSASAQNDYGFGGSEGNSNPFAFKAGLGVVFTAGGYNSSLTEPSISLEMDGYPTDMFFLGFRMRALMPYSPATKSTTLVQYDSNHTYSQTSYDKASTTYFVIGLMEGKNKDVMGTINTGFGIAFLEQGNTLVTTFAWDISLEGGYNFSKKFGLLLSATYSYAGMSYRGYATDGFGVVTELKGVMNF